MEDGGRQVPIGPEKLQENLNKEGVMREHGPRAVLVAVFLILGVLCVGTPSWAVNFLNTPVYDADKPYPIAPNDLSCWIASAANMLAADGWDNGNVQDIYNKLKANTTAGAWGPAFKVGTGWRGGFQSQALTYALATFTTMPGYDPTEVIDVYNSWRAAWSYSLTPEALITDLLQQVQPDGTRDPVGIGFYGIGIAHAVTAWGERTLTNGRVQLAITDSDDRTDSKAYKGVVYVSWLNPYTLNYYGRIVRVGYVSYLSEAGEAFTFVVTGTSDGLGSGLPDTPPLPYYPSIPVPIPGALLLFGPGLAGLAAIRKRFKK
jgi:hypothetical protein